MRKILVILFSVLAVIVVAFGGTKLYSANTLPKCDSKFAEDVVSELFIENLRLYSTEDISSFGLHSFAPEDYNDSIKKYSCRAIMTLGIGRGHLTGYKQDFDVRYEIYKERGENMVSLNRMAGGRIYKD